MDLNLNWQAPLLLRTPNTGLIEIRSVILEIDQTDWRDVCIMHFMRRTLAVHRYFWLFQLKPAFIYKIQKQLLHLLYRS
jgi:hypothetical protein